MKACTKCKAHKPFSYFAKNRTTLDGYERRCKKCRNAWYRARYAVAPDLARERAARWYSTHPTRTRELRKKHADRRRVDKRDWAQRNAGRCTAKVAARTAAKLKATPSWLTPLDYAAIDLIYAMAKWESVSTGVKHSVDHIYPLRGKTVCGLHIPRNLQIIPASENLSKGNRLPEFL